MMEKWVGMALADSANDDGVCWPAVDTISHKCSCSRRSVQNAIRGLESKQLLRTVHRKDRSSYYIFNIANLPQIERPKRCKEAGPYEIEGTGAGDAPDLFCTGAGHSATGAGHSGRGAGDAPRTVIEPSDETPKNLYGDFEEKSPVVSDRESLCEFVSSEWATLKTEAPGIRGIRSIDNGLRQRIFDRAKQHARPGEHPGDVWKEVFDAIRRSRFLRGLAPPSTNHPRPFKLGLDWLTKAENFRCVIGGKYDDDGIAGSYDPATGRRYSPAEQATRAVVARLGPDAGGRVGGRDPRSGLDLRRAAR